MHLHSIRRAALSIVLGAPVVVALGTTACARPQTSADPSASAFDPVGRYEYTSAANGQTVNGFITISRRESGLTGLMTTGVTRDLAFETVRVSGNRVTMETSTPSARVAVELIIDRADVTGTWQMGAMGGSLRGKRVAGP